MRLAENKSFWQKASIAIGAFVLLGIYWCIYKIWGIAIPCVWFEVTGLYCPGCGITRMFESILVGDFYQAFRYNQLCFFLLPLAVALFINYWYALYKGRDNWLSRIPEPFWVVLTILAILFGIVRNLPCGSMLAPVSL